jgi:hypothetical protein
MYNFHLNEKKDTSHNIDPICISLTINFCENLQEYYFVRNQFLIIKNVKIYIISNNKVFLFLFKYKNRIKTIYMKNYYVLIPDLNSARKTG